MSDYERVAKTAERLGLNGPFPQAQYVQYIERAFGRDGARFLDAVDAWISQGAPADEAGRLYSLLARRPAMAAYVSRHQYSALYVSAAQVLHASGLLHKAQVVDYGCGFGQFTQMLAHLYPESEFIGMDVSPVIAAARRITAKNAAGNLRFAELKSDLGSADRDRIILMMCVIHEMFPELGVRGGTPDPGVEAEAAWPNLVEPGTRLITINRLPYPHWQLPQLDGVMAKLGLQVVSSPLPDAVTVAGGGGPSRLPIRVYQRVEVLEVDNDLEV